MPERIPIASDHAGYDMKEALEQALRELGHDPQDLGAESESPSDYPDYAHRVARLVSEGKTKRGVLLCGSGVGMDIVANRYKGVRAGVIWNKELADLTRRHNDLNLLVLPARFISVEDAKEILKTFLETEFEGGRHGRRVEKIDQPEARA